MLRLGPTPIKSAILSYLTTEEVCVEGIIRTIESHQVPDSWKVSVGVAKEREFKRVVTHVFTVSWSRR